MIWKPIFWSGEKEGETRTDIDVQYAKRLCLPSMKNHSNDLLETELLFTTNLPNRIWFQINTPSGLCVVKIDVYYHRGRLQWLSGPQANRPLQVQGGMNQHKKRTTTNTILGRAAESEATKKRNTAVLVVVVVNIVVWIRPVSSMILMH